MFSLKVDREVQGASIWARWCLDKETKDFLEQHASGVVRLLLVVVAGSGLTSRLVPLDNVVQILPARYPGKNTILSAIVWGSTLRELKDRYLYNNYSLLDYPERDEKDEGIRIAPRYKSCLMGPTISVDVPKEIFAPEPPEWEKKWVNLWFPRPAVDQCDFRKRRIIAYTVQPIFLLLKVCITGLFALFAILLMLIAGFSRITWTGFETTLWEAVDIDVYKGSNYWYRLWQRIFPKKNAKVDREFLKMDERERARLKSMYESITCEDGEKPSPPARQTIFLIYHGIKDRVCKPFAG